MRSATAPLPDGDGSNEHDEYGHDEAQTTTKHLLASFFDQEFARVGQGLRARPSDRSHRHLYLPANHGFNGTI